jgi:hypothetical protein
MVRGRCEPAPQANAGFDMADRHRVRLIAQPDQHIFLKPNVTRRAAEKYGYAFHYRSRPAWKTYADLLGFASRVRTDLGDLRPRDMIDLQSFLWVQGSEEYPD